VSCDHVQAAIKIRIVSPYACLEILYQFHCISETKSSAMKQQSDSDKNSIRMSEVVNATK